MIKILEYFGEPLEYGGEEMFMLNMYKHFSDKNLSFTIGTAFNLTNKFLIDFAEKRNEKIYHFDYDTNSHFRRKYAKKCLKKILSKENFDIVHIHSSSLFILYGCAKIAKKMSVKKVIVHSHIAANESLKHLLFKKLISDRYFQKYANTFLACSHAAAQFQYSNKIIDSKKYDVINNGIEPDKFHFHLETRTEYRKMLGLGNNITILNVGRFSKVKNQEFIVSIAEEMIKITKTVKFILVGDGENKNEIIQKVKQQNLMDYFIFLEKRNDINKIMMASDVFILPSLFEGLAVTSIESQATGLPTICSSSITRETAITDLYSALPIDNARNWAIAILNSQAKKHDRSSYSQLISTKGYSAQSSANKLEHLYLTKE